MTLIMVDQARQQLQQKMISGCMEENTIVKIANPLGSPKTLNPWFVYRIRLYKSIFSPIPFEPT